jgi:predicted  nucleic acid-binding Zn-ribbon protein
VRAASELHSDARAADARADMLASDLRAEMAVAISRARAAARAESTAVAEAAAPRNALLGPSADRAEVESVAETVRAHATALRALREHLSRHEEVQAAVARGISSLQADLAADRNVLGEALGGGGGGRAAAESAADLATARASARDALARANAAVLGVRELESLCRERLDQIDARIGDVETTAVRSGEDARSLAAQQSRLSELHSALGTQVDEIRKRVAQDLARLATRVDGKAEADAVLGKAEGADVERLHASLNRLLSEMTADPARLYAHRRFYSSRPHLLNAYRVAPAPGGGVLWPEQPIPAARTRARRAHSAGPRARAAQPLTVPREPPGSKRSSRAAVQVDSDGDDLF